MKRGWMRAAALCMVCAVLAGPVGCGKVEKDENDALPDAAQEKYEFKKEKISAQSGEHKVVAILFLPQDTESPCPLVVVSHGFGANYTYYVELCEQLAENGVAAAAIDFYGGSGRSLSGGTMEEMTVFTEQEDLEAVIDVLKDREDIDGERISLVGHSQGGFVSTLVAAARPDEIDGLYLIAPAFMIPDSMRSMFSTYEEIQMVKAPTGTIGEAYAKAVYEYDIFPEMEKYAGKVHIWHGTQDQSVPMEYSERAVETFEDASLTKVEGMEHNKFDAIQDEMCAEIVQDLESEK